jgi:hypothetical protein
MCKQQRGERDSYGNRFKNVSERLVDAKKEEVNKSWSVPDSIVRESEWPPPLRLLIF